MSIFGQASCWVPACNTCSMLTHRHYLSALFRYKCNWVNFRKCQKVLSSYSLNKKLLAAATASIMPAISPVPGVRVALKVEAANTSEG